MKKSMIAFVLIFALAVTGLAVGGGALLDWQDDLDVTEETVSGDVSAAEGLQVYTRGHHRSYFLWETTYDAAKEPNSRTDFTYFTTSQNYREPEESTVRLESKSPFFQMSGSGIVISMDDSVYTKPAVDVALRTENGTTHTETVRLKDYHDYYAVGLDIYYGRNFLSKLGLLNTVSQSSTVDLTDYFQIPVNEELQMDISVTRNEKGQLTEVKSSPPEGKSEYDYSLSSDGVVTSDAVWFALTPYNEQNLDLSQLKLGYGLYRAPLYRYDVTSLQPSAGGLKNVWPVDYPNTVIRSVDQNEDGTRLFVLTKEQEGFFMNVLSTEDCSLIDRLAMQEMSPYLVHLVEDLLVLVSYDQQLQQHRIVAYDLQTHEKWLDGELPVDQIYDMQEPAFAFDGERLAVADFGLSNGFLRLLIYGPEGLRYMGQYSSAKYYFDTHLENSLTLTWQ